MTISALTGPVVTFPENPYGTGEANQNPESGPSLFAHAVAVLDLRQQYTYIPGQNFGKQTSGWLSDLCQTIDQVPTTATANNIATAQTATAGTAMTLVAANTTGVTVGAVVTSATTGLRVTGLLALDGAATTVAFGSARTVQIWDPTSLLARNVKITSNADDTSGTYTVRGYDIYGFPMSETITGANGTSGTTAATAGAKAFKYVTSVTPAGTVNSTGATVGTGDVIGLPLRADRWSELLMTFGNTSITASTGFTAAVTSAASATTGDTRGTYSLQTSSNGVLRFTVKQMPQVSNVNTTAGLTGVLQA